MIDASIALGVKPMQIESPVNSLAKVLQIQQAEQANQLGKMQLDEHQQKLSSQNRLQRVLSAFGQDHEANAIGLAKEGFLSEADAYRKSISAQMKDNAEIESKRMTDAKTRQELIGQAFGHVNDNPTSENAQFAIDYLYQNRVLTQEIRDKLLQGLASDSSPAAILKTASALYQSGLSTKDQKPEKVDPNKPFLLGPSGEIVPNIPFQKYDLGRAKAGASSVSVSVSGPENKYNETVGKGLADAGLGVVDQAKAAPDIVRNAQMIKSAIANGAITGTAAETRLAVQKALETVGLVGEGKAADTEALIAGLNKMTLGAIKTSGLGAGNGFTNADRDFLAASASGKIEATPANLLRAADLSEKAARASHSKGVKVLGRWSGDRALSAVAQDTAIDPLPEQPQSLPPKNNQGWSLKVDAKGNKAYVSPDGKQFKEVK